MPVLDTNDLAKKAYLAYGSVTDYKNYQGLPMPEFEDLTPKIKEAWATAAIEIWNYALAQAEKGEVI